MGERAEQCGGAVYTSGEYQLPFYSELKAGNLVGIFAQSSSNDNFIFRAVFEI